MVLLLPRCVIVVGGGDARCKVLAHHPPADQSGYGQHHGVQPLGRTGIVPGILSAAGARRDRADAANGHLLLRQLRWSHDHPHPARAGAIATMRARSRHARAKPAARAARSRWMSSTASLSAISRIACSIPNGWRACLARFSAAATGRASPAAHRRIGAAGDQIGIVPQAPLRRIEAGVADLDDLARTRAHPGHGGRAICGIICAPWRRVSRSPTTQSAPWDRRRSC